MGLTKQEKLDRAFKEAMACRKKYDLERLAKVVPAMIKACKDSMDEIHSIGENYNVPSVTIKELYRTLENVVSEAENSLNNYKSNFLPDEQIWNI